MEILRNSIWEKNKKDNAISMPRHFRVLNVYWKLNLVIIYPLDKNKNKLCRPLPINLELLDRFIAEKIIIQSQFEIPSFMMMPENDLKKSWIDDRNNRYVIIRPLVEDDEFIIRMAVAKRFLDIVNLAKKENKKPSSIHRLLNLYWRYGQRNNALITFHSNCGGKGVQKNSSFKKRGKPAYKSMFGFENGEGVNVTEKYKSIVKEYMPEYYKNGGITKKGAYDDIVVNHYFDEIESAEQQNRKPEIVSLRQFYYWLPKVTDEVELDKIILGETQYEMNHRELLGSVSENVHGPGDCFEIDATVADVFIVSEFDRNRILGKPVIYVIVDEASRMVVGLHVTIFWASWDSAKQALLNAFLPKQEYCARYGVQIENNQWPCCHYPRSLLVDNGEMVWDKPETHFKELGIQIHSAAVFRGDWKGIVERRFGIANAKTLHGLRGTTRGQWKKRGEKDPRDDAFYTVNEITTLLIKMFVDYNRFHKFDCLITKGLVSDNIKPTPLNYWDWHVQHHRDSLTMAEPDQARAELLIKTEASVTGEGILVEGRRYSCTRAENENWFVMARKHGAWKLDARIDSDNSSVIWVRPEDRENLIECNLLKKDSIYSNLPKADVIYLTEWSKHKKEDADEFIAHSEYKELKNKIDKQVLIEKKMTKSIESKTARKKNIRQNRLDEQEKQKNKIDITKSVVRVEKTRNNDAKLMSLIEKACEDDDV